MKKNIPIWDWNTCPASGFDLYFPLCVRTGRKFLEGWHAFF